jgi:uncharacterized protein YbjT (DUF2867 family)
MIVVTTPTGNIGQRVLANVLAAGQPARVVARDAGRLPREVRDRVEVVTGSLSDPAVMARALDGADALFWLKPRDRTSATVESSYLDFSRPAVEAIRDQGVTRVVDVSALGRGTPYADHAGNVTASLAMDDLIAGTGVAFRALACASFMENMLRQAQPIAERGVFTDIISPDLHLPVVAVRDIGDVAARLLLDSGWAGQQEVPLLGPEDLSMNDRAAIMSDVLERPVRYTRISPQELLDRISGLGTSPGMAQGMLDMTTAKDNGLDNGVIRTPRRAVDTPTTFRQWCEDTLKPAVLAASPAR